MAIQHTPRLGLQLYSVREAMAKDLTGTLQAVAEIGFDGVETAFFEGVTLEQAAQHLRDYGLRAFCAHVDLPLGEKRDAVLRTAELFGCDRIVWHGWPEDPRYGSLDGIHQLADEYNAAHEVAQAHGLTLGLHNHWWEMTPVAGRLPYQVLRERIDARIFFELDVYWATVAGRVGAEVVRDLGARAPLLHLKDGPLTRHDPMTALGTGALPIPDIIAGARAHAEWVIVELDECATDMLEAVRQSHAYLKHLL